MPMNANVAFDDDRGTANKGIKFTDNLDMAMMHNDAMFFGNILL